MQGTPAQFNFSQQKEVQTIYDEFKDPFQDKLIVEDFIPILVQAGLSERCQMLMRKLKKQQAAIMEQKEFEKLFDFNLESQDNMNLLFDVLDVNGKGKISLDDLKLANNKYKIGLTEQDMKMMITYTDVKDQPITKEVFKKLIKE